MDKAPFSISIKQPERLPPLDFSILRSSSPFSLLPLLRIMRKHKRAICSISHRAFPRVINVPFGALSRSNVIHNGVIWPDNGGCTRTKFESEIRKGWSERSVLNDTDLFWRASIILSPSPPSWIGKAKGLQESRWFLTRVNWWKGSWNYSSSLSRYWNSADEWTNDDNAIVRFY